MAHLSENNKSIDAFDRASISYDRDFTQTSLGRLYRDRVQTRLISLFKPGMLVLDIGCGTGDDALFLANRGLSVVACDFSPGMLEKAETKIKQAGMLSNVQFRHLKAQDLANIIEELPMGFDGIYSNFGPLNMIEDLPRFAKLTSRLLDPGGVALHVVMGRKPLFELIYFLMHFRFSRAFARWNGSAKVPVAGWKLPCRFYQPGEIEDYFKLYFSVTRIEALGVLLPPPHLTGHYRKRLKFYRRFKSLDRQISCLPIFNTMGDHFIIEMTREPDLVSHIA